MKKIGYCPFVYNIQNPIEINTDALFGDHHFVGL